MACDERLRTSVRRRPRAVTVTTARRRLRAESAGRAPPQDGRAPCVTTRSIGRRQDLDGHHGAAAALVSRSRRSATADRHRVADAARCAPVRLTGSVVASVSRFTTLSGPTTSTIAGVADDLARRRSPARDRPRRPATTGTRLADRCLEGQRDGRRGRPAAPRRRTARAPARASGGTAGGPARAVDRSSTRDEVAGAQPAERAGRRRARARPRSRACSPISSSCSGMFWNSSGTRSARSACFCPATDSQSTSASATDSTFRPRWRKRPAHHQPNEYQRCRRAPPARR